MTSDTQRKQVFRWLAQTFPNGLQCAACERFLFEDTTIVVIQSAEPPAIEIVCTHCTHGMRFYPSEDVFSG